MLSKEDYCDYETSIALKDLGFPLKTLKVGGEIKNVPILLYEAQKWLREEKKLHLEISMFSNKYDVEIIRTETDQYGIHDVLYEKCEYNSYEQALLIGIKETIKILKEA